MLDHVLERIMDALDDIFWWSRWSPPAGQDPSGMGPPGRSSIPDVRGLDVDDARTALAREGFRIDVRRVEERPAPVMGIVIDQDPRPGRRRRRGNNVTIVVRHPPDRDAPT